jgi:hypothetical protein
MTSYERDHIDVSYERDHIDVSYERDHIDNPMREIIQ